MRRSPGHYHGGPRLIMVEVEGAKQLRRTLKEAGGDLKDLKAANKGAAEIAANAAAELAPVRSGALAKSVRAAGTQTAGIIRAGNNRKTAAGVPYGGVIHWGHPARGIKANTFVTDAAQQTESVWVNLYIDKMNETIQQIEGK